jgi:putative transposase
MTYRILKAAGRLDRKIVTPSKKGTGFIQPTKLHQAWHVDVSYINVDGSFSFLISVLDGFSRCIVSRCRQGCGSAAPSPVASPRQSGHVSRPPRCWSKIRTLFSVKSWSISSTIHVSSRPSKSRSCRLRSLIPTECKIPRKPRGPIQFS